MTLRGKVMTESNTRGVQDGSWIIGRKPLIKVFSILATFFFTPLALAQTWECQGSSGLSTELANIRQGGPTWLNTDRAVERSLLFLDACPTDFLNVMDTDSKILDSWSEALHSFVSHSHEREQLRVIGSLAQTIGERLPQEGHAAGVVRQAMVAVRQVPRKNTMSHNMQRRELYRWALDNTLNDWQRADGEFVRWLSDDLLFLLALDPSSFANRMKHSPTVARSWLERIADLSFTGLPENRDRVEAFRSELVRNLERRHPTGYLKRVLDRLGQVSFKGID